MIPKISVCPKFVLPHTRELVERFAEAGVDEVIFVVGARDANHCLDRMDILAREVVEPAAKM